jgi:uncharacterized protein (TIGR00730 family)
MIGNLWKNKKETKLDPRFSAHDLTHSEIKEGARRRLATIQSEFKHTFKFLKSYPHSVSFFGSARFTEDHPYYIQARKLAGRIAKELGYTIVTGGGPGIMEAANRGAFEVGGKSVGMNIILPHEQKMNEYLTAHIRFYYFFIRKVALSFSAECYVFFPGGYGTLDEFFELVTLIQTRKIPRVPVICVGKEFWSHVDTMSASLRDDFQTISPGDEKIYQIVESEDEIFEAIKKAPFRKE